MKKANINGLHWYGFIAISAAGMFLLLPMLEQFYQDGQLVLSGGLLLVLIAIASLGLMTTLFVLAYWNGVVTVQENLLTKKRLCGEIEIPLTSITSLTISEDITRPVAGNFITIHTTDQTEYHWLCSSLKALRLFRELKQELQK